MSKTNIQIVQELLAGATRAEVVDSLVAEGATYVSLTFDNPELHKIMPRVAAVQRQAKAVVERYQQGLNRSDFSIIRPLFAPDAVAEWNEKTTVVGVEAMAGPYEALFKKAEFDTDFQYDAVTTADIFTPSSSLS